MWVSLLPRRGAVRADRGSWYELPLPVLLTGRALTEPVLPALTVSRCAVVARADVMGWGHDQSACCTSGPRLTHGGFKSYARGQFRRDCGSWALIGPEKDETSGPPRNFSSR